jgi:predicted nucleic acid-binding protein
VARWLQGLPSWVQVASVQQVDPTIQLGAGENEAISLAMERQAKIILMDERRGRSAAEERGLVPLGTLNLIDLADAAGLADGLQLLAALRKTTFRASIALLEASEQKMAARRHAQQHP